MNELPLEQEYAALLTACTNYKRRAEAAEDAIAAAVSAEREACAVVADKHEHEAYVKKISADDRATVHQRTVQQDMAQRIAAAIRARSNGAGSK